MIALSGSFMTFSQSRYDRSHPNVREPHVSLDKILAALQAAYPKLYGPWTFELPMPGERPLTAKYSQSSSSDKDIETPLLVSIDAASGRLISATSWSRSFQGRLHALHTQLLLGESGEVLVGSIGVATLGLLASGFLVWLGNRAMPPAPRPVNGHLLSTAAKRMHRLVGLCSLPFLLILAVTGTGLSLPQSLAWLGTTPSMPHFAEPASIRSTAEPNSRPVGLEEAALVARGLFPHAALRRITTPAGEIGVYRVELCQLAENDCLHPQTVVWVDRYSGQIREVQNPVKFSWSQRMSADLIYYHSGGWIGQFIWFVIGLVPMGLFLSGMYAWASRRGWATEQVLDGTASARWRAGVRDFAGPRTAAAATLARRWVKALLLRLVHLREPKGQR